MYLFLKFFSKLPLKFIQHFAKKVGYVLYISNSSARKTTRNNIDIAFPHLKELDKEALVLSSLKSQCMTYSESIKIWGSSTQFSLDQIKNVYGLEIFLNALKNPNGSLAALPHFGTWELLNAWINQHTSPVIMYKPNKNKELDKFVLKSRERLNTTLVPTDESGVRSIFKYLKQGGFSVILPDHVPKESGGIYSPFFNKNSLTSTLFSKLAAKTQCSVIGMYCLRCKDLEGFDIYIKDLSQDILSKDLQISVDTLNKEIEQIILSAPEQYLWGYKRFRKTI